MGVEVVLGQHGLQLLGEIVPSGEELQIVALLRVGHRTTAKKRCSDEGLYAVLALEVLRPDAQGRFLACVAEKLQQALDLHHILDAELKHRAGGALLAQHIPPDARSGGTAFGQRQPRPRSRFAERCRGHRSIYQNRPPHRRRPQSSMVWRSYGAGSRFLHLVRSS